MESQLDSVLFPEVASTDFLGFGFGSTSYAEQLQQAREKSNALCGVSCSVRIVGEHRVVLLEHNWGFFGGSLGCAEGEKLCRGFEYAAEHGLPCIVQSRSGGARMQEGTSSLMQMAKVSVAVAAFKRCRKPFISIMVDPTYGGVSASYASQGDIRISVKGARIGFAGPAIILNTVYEMNQQAYDANCPPQFQSAEFLHSHGQIDIVVDTAGDLAPTVASILTAMTPLSPLPAVPGPLPSTGGPVEPNYTATRAITRYQPMDIVTEVFDDFVELSGDGSVGKDRCITGGIARLGGRPCVVVLTRKGHSVAEMHAANYGMADPVGYRTALRLFRLAEQWGVPVVSMVDTVGAYPSFGSEETGQSEALATNLLAMAELQVPFITLLVGEGGSGGALGIAMGDKVAMLQRGYYAVISPEGAASILGRYKDEAHKQEQFPKDCAALAERQHIYAHQLAALGVIDDVINEDSGEDYTNWPVLQSRIKNYLARQLKDLSGLKKETLLERRHKKFRQIGKFELVETPTSTPAAEPVEEGTKAAAAATAPVEKPKEEAAPKPKPTGQLIKMEEKSEVKDGVAGDTLTHGFPDRTNLVGSLEDVGLVAGDPTPLLKWVADTTINGANSAHLGKEPAGMERLGDITLTTTQEMKDRRAAHRGAKQVLDEEGPEAVATWLKGQRNSGVLITDTTMRDAQQSLMATRVRTVDLLEAADFTSAALAKCFSLEMWGGATFDVCYRFLHEDPWQRLRALRKAIPNICFQMLIRGSNAVGYTSYPDNVIIAFVRLAARNGIDVFRIFDCFNDVSQMEMCIRTVKEEKKIAEVCMCFTGNFLSADEKIYTLDYYTDLAKRIEAAGAHMIGLKDMAGLFRPQMAEPFMKAIRSVTDLPIHFHAHATSSASLASALNMANNGCEIVDLAMSSMADLTSQPSLNALVRSLEHTPRNADFIPTELEQLSLYWENVRSWYAPFESGMKAGTAKVYDHQIPGGQYSNLIVQCNSMGLSHRWGEVLDMYANVNRMFGDIIKVTPSSKVVGDMALFLLNKNMTCEDVMERGSTIEFPKSVVDMMAGDLGTPHHGWPEDIRKIVLKNREPLTCRPGALKPPADFPEHHKLLSEQYEGIKFGIEDVVSSLLYPKVYDDYLKRVDKCGGGTPHVTTKAFWYGMKVGQCFGLKEWIPKDGSTPVKVELCRVHPIKTPGRRTLTFKVNGEKQIVEVDETLADAAGACTARKADPANANHVASPLPGAVEKVLCAEGEEVKKDQVLMVVSAMKMEVSVPAPRDGVVKEVPVAPGDRVDTGSLLVVLA